MFETKWSRAGNGTIHAYNEPDTIKTIAIADGNNEISEIKDGSVYNSSSSSRTISNGEILILENINGYFAAIKIIDVKYKNQMSTINELNFDFQILDDKSSNFSSIE
jgi:hypothetical protein